MSINADKKHAMM
jgi:hypothetical protein